MKNIRARLVLALALVFCSLSHAQLPAAIAKLKPSILLVGTYKETSSPRFAMRGTGFVVAAAGEGSGNLIITNAHVLPQPADTDVEATLVVQIFLTADQLQPRAAKVLEVDAAHDLALLQFDGAALPAVRVADSDKVQEGQSVAFMGFPIGGALGFSPVTHRGSISAITAAVLPMPAARNLNARTIRTTRDNAGFKIFQLDATAYPGNSGGPLFDPDSGDLLGVVNMVFIKGTKESALSAPSGISYAIPGNYVAALLQRAAQRP